MKLTAVKTFGTQLLTDADVANSFHVSKRTVVYWRNAGKLPYLRLGTRAIRYRPESIEAMLEKMEKGGI